MVFRLQLPDGSIREYPVVHPRAEGRTVAKCGAPDCEHLDCALACGEDLGRLYMGVIALMASIILFLTLFIFIFIPWAEEGGSPGAYDPVRIALGIAIVINIIGIAWYVRVVTGSRARERELREFRGRGTIGGVQARQVFQGAVAGDRSRRS